MEETTLQSAEEPQAEQPAQPPKKKSEMRKRIITGVLYICVLLAFFALKVCVDDFLFDPLVLAFAVFGTYEMLRAFRDKMTLPQKVIVMIFVVLVLVTFAVSDYIFKRKLDATIGSGNSNYTPLITFVVFITGLAILLGLLVFTHEKVSLESTGYTLISYIYPTVFLIVLMGVNHLEKYSAVAILFVFIICPFADTFAFIFGKSFGKYLPAKMAPHVSPKKTLIGGFGGLVGGAIGAIVVFFIYYGFALPVIPNNGIAFDNVRFEWNEMIFYIGIGVIAAAFAQFGDLVESAIKRKIGIKDMGKILPGHGGILDRIDSSLYASLVICLIFTIRIMI